MKPNDIKRIIAAAKSIKEKEAHPTPFFLLSWTAWEALRTRTLRVAMFKLGWSVTDANTALKSLRISGMTQAADAFVRLGLGQPAHWNGMSGRVWRQFQRIEVMRHRLTHGFDSLNPSLIRAAGIFVLAALQDRTWIEKIAVPVQDGDPQPLGDIFAPQRRGIRKSTSPRSYDQLVALFNTRSAKPPSLPSVEELKIALKWFHKVS